MKKLLSIIILLSALISVNAQNVYVHLKDGSYSTFNVNDIYKINFNSQLVNSLHINEHEVWVTFDPTVFPYPEFTLEVTHDGDPELGVKWESSDPEVARIDYGTVRVRGVGATTITAHISGSKAYCQVYVVENITNTEQAKAAVQRCYDPLLGLNGGWNEMVEHRINDPYKPAVGIGLQPTLDVQSSGLERDWNTQNYKNIDDQLTRAYCHAYHNIKACNILLQNLNMQLSNNNISIPTDIIKQVEGEVRAIRAYAYFWLATTFGRVPIIDENSTTDKIAQPHSFEEMWDFIIYEFKKASELLTWDFEKMLFPYSCTKGMALSYLGDAYMWKAYRCPTSAYECYQNAKECLARVIDSGIYQLQNSYSTLWDFEDGYTCDAMTGYLNAYNRKNNKESIFQIVLFEGDKWGSWADCTGAHGWTGFYWGDPANGGWYAYSLSWELYDAFEAGDKRRDASMVASPINPNTIINMGKDKWFQSFTLPKWIEANPTLLGVSEAEYKGFNISEINSKYDMNHPMGLNPFNQQLVNYCYFHFSPQEPQPTVYSTKHWRNGKGTNWFDNALWLPDHLYLKRLANVMLDYAECCFRTGDETTGWAQIDALRNRAFGNTEVGHADQLNVIFGKYFSQLASKYNKDIHGNYVDLGSYPIPFATSLVTVPSAKDYYTNLKQQKGFSSEVWKVAVNEERRKELNAETCLRADMQKSGYMSDHLLHNYPKEGDKSGDEYATDWETYKSFKFDERKLTFPFTKTMMDYNPNLSQNPGY